MGLYHHKICVCGKNRATIKVTRVGEDGAVEDQWICSDCAAERSPLHQRPEGEATDLQALLNMMKQKSEAAAKVDPDATPEADPDLACPGCSMTLEQYRKTFLLGCPRCYEVFAEALTTDLRKIHGATRHIGKSPIDIPPAPEMPAPPKPAASKTGDLKRQLRHAIENEDFEEAARLRDEIRRQKEESGG